TEYLRRLREICDRREAMLVFDEVQTGFYATGKTWCFQHLGVEPDIVAFGKKAQICGVFANARIDGVERNVFVEASRINSTWGGNLADMVRCKWIQRAMLRDGMPENATRVGDHVASRLRDLGSRLPDGWLSAARARGTLIAFDCPSKESRDALIKACYRRRLLVLGCGERSIRFRPPLNLSTTEADEAIARLTASLGDLNVKPAASVPVC
ncbi:MAG TPA: aminotransferase class III-fold pyridoxal phosphate-dependent enzyme, partial [Planctomycetota bacterium]|nr:aminotransferase class III-fold pyridoxal phosphate-dependent enzyme [Planctomycetota bacterium]